MIDFVKLTTTIQDKDNAFLSNLELESSHILGWKNYILKGVTQDHKTLKVCINEVRDVIVIEGSLPYYWQGHNYSFGIDALDECVQLISALLGFDISEMQVVEFEYGKVLEVGHEPSRYIRDAYACEDSGLKNCSHKDWRNNLIRWESTDKIKCRGKNIPSFSLKMYDAKKNGNKKWNAVGKSCVAEGNHLKIELHHNAPSMLVGGKLYFGELCSADFQEHLDEVLDSLLDKLSFSRKVSFRKKPTTQGVVFGYVFEDALNEGKHLEDVQSAMFAYIRGVDWFTAQDRSNRKRQMKKYISEVVQNTDNDDLKEELKKLICL